MFKKKLTHNFILKVLSVLVALSLWGYATWAQKSEIGFTVPVEFKNVPKHLIITEETADVVNIRIEGMRSTILGLSVRKLSVPLDMSDAEAGETVFKIAPETINLPVGTKVKKLDPQSITVTLERLMSKTVPIKVQLKGQPASGYQVGQILVDPPVLTIQGPVNQVRGVSTIPTLSIDITNLSSTIVRKIDTVLPSRNIFVEGKSSVSVEIRIDAIFIKKRFNKVSVKLIGKPGDTVAEKRVNITVWGPQLVLDVLSSKDIAAIINTTNLKPGKHVLGAEIGLPNDVSLLQMSPSKFHVTVK